MWKVKEAPPEIRSREELFSIQLIQRDRQTLPLSDSMDLHFEVELTGSYDLGEVKEGRGGRYWYMISRSKKSECTL